MSIWVVIITSVITLLLWATVLVLLSLQMYKLGRKSGNQKTSVILMSLGCVIPIILPFGVSHLIGTNEHRYNMLAELQIAIHESQLKNKKSL